MTMTFRVLAAAVAAATVGAAQAQSTIAIVSHPLGCSSCGELFNEVLSPITGVKYAK